MTTNNTGSARQQSRNTRGGAGEIGEENGEPGREQLPHAQIACRMASHIARLEPGPAASLRRGPLHGTGAYTFWRLITRYEPKGYEQAIEGWAAVAQAIAILTPKGRDDKKPPAHDGQRAFGRALAEAGVSVARLTQMLTTPPPRRRHLAIAACRRIARTKSPRIDVRTLCALMLEKSDTVCDQVAADYAITTRRRGTTGSERETTT